MATWEYKRLNNWIRNGSHGWTGPEVAARFEAGTRGEHCLELFTYGPEMADDPSAKEFMAVLARTKLDDATLLDYGCGNAVYKQLLSIHELTHRWSYVGVDVNRLSIESCRRRYPEGMFKLIEEGQKLPFPAQFADVVLASGVLEYVEHPVKLLQEFSRVSKDWVLLCRIAAMRNFPSAMYLQTVHHDWGTEEHPMHLFNACDIETMIQNAGLHIVWCQISPANGVLDWVDPREPPVEHFYYLLRKTGNTI